MEAEASLKVAWQNHLQHVIDPEAEKRVEEMKQKGCEICGSHDFGWVGVEGWRGTCYYTCLNCIAIKDLFTTA